VIDIPPTYQTSQFVSRGTGDWVEVGNRPPSDFPRQMVPEIDVWRPVILSRRLHVMPIAAWCRSCGHLSATRHSAFTHASSGPSLRVHGWFISSVAQSWTAPGFARFTKTLNSFHVEPTAEPLASAVSHKPDRQTSRA